MSSGFDFCPETMARLMPMKISEIFFTLGSLFRQLILWLPALVFLAACSEPLNNPYRNDELGKSILYNSFSERPKHLDPAVSYSSDEYALIGQIYEPPLQYHYLKRPYSLVPLTAESMPKVTYFDAGGLPLPEDAPAEKIAFSEYEIAIKPGILFQSHPAFAKNGDGDYRYHDLTPAQLAGIRTLQDFEVADTRELTADDYVYQIKRLVHPKIHSPIAELMKEHIVGLKEFAAAMARLDKERAERFLDVRAHAIEGVATIDRYRYKIQVKGKYPQFQYWLAMPFFAPMAWEADRFYSQPALIEKNITLDWYPVGTGPYMLIENNPNRRMVLVRNPNFHDDFYPREGEPEDEALGLIEDAGNKLPFIDRVDYILEKETIPYWNKFLQGYYDASGIASDSFDQAIRFSGGGEAELTPAMKEKGIHLQTAVTTSIFYVGFNMLDPIVGGYEESRRKLRQAISIAIDYEEYISIFLNGRGIPAQGIIPPEIFGHAEGAAGINPYVYDWVEGEARRKAIAYARQLMEEAGYPNGRDIRSGQPLLLYFDTAAAGVDDRSLLNWYRKQFDKLGIQLVVRATDYNRFQEKIRVGNAQIFVWGWNADYPDPENFFFLLYGPNGKVAHGGENAVNYASPEFDALFERMRNMDNNGERFALIQRMQDLIRRDAPWIYGFHPKVFSLYHDWYGNLKPNLMANNRLKYTKIDIEKRAAARAAWNEPVHWPLLAALILLVLAVLPAALSYRRKAKEPAL